MNIPSLVLLSPSAAEPDAATVKRSPRSANASPPSETPPNPESSCASSADCQLAGQSSCENEFRSACSRNRSAAARLGNSHPRAYWTRVRAEPAAFRLKASGPAENLEEAPAVAPPLAPTARTTETVPSEFGVTVSVFRPPSSTNRQTAEASCPRRSDSIGQGRRPAAAAICASQMSRPATQSARSSCLMTAAAIEGAPTAGAARRRTAAMRAIVAMYSVVAWPAVGRVRTTLIGRPEKVRPRGSAGGESGAREAVDQISEVNALPASRAMSNSGSG